MNRPARLKAERDSFRDEFSFTDVHDEMAFELGQMSGQIVDLCAQIESLEAPKLKHGHERAALMRCGVLLLIDYSVDSDGCTTVEHVWADRNDLADVMDGAPEWAIERVWAHHETQGAARREAAAQDAAHDKIMEAAQ